jgi:hypothetical protein
MLTCLVSLRERCAFVTVFARRRRFPLRAMATRESGIPPLARVVLLVAACGVFLALTAPPAFADIAGACCLGGACQPMTRSVCLGNGNRFVGGACAGDLNPVNGIDDACEAGGPTFDGCGGLIAGAETGCVLFQADGGGVYVLGNYGGFTVGARVRVTGFLNPICNTTCIQGDGCIDINTIGVCPVVPAVSEWGLFILSLLVLCGLTIRFGRRAPNVKTCPLRTLGAQHESALIF